MAYMNKSQTDKWNSPPHIIENIKVRYGKIDLDAATDVSNPVGADAIHTEHTDGLKRNWWGLTYVNPPYGRGLLNWVKKAIEEFESERCHTIIMLLPSRTDTRWFHLLLEYKYARIEFIKGRLRYGEGKDNAPFPSILVTIQKPLW